MDEYDITRTFYDEHAKEYEKNTASLSRKEKMDAFTSRLSPGGSILDVGCAYGRDCALFADAGFDVTGVDFSDTLIDLALEKVPNAQFQTMSLLQLDFEDETFDGIWCNAVLLHIKKEDIPTALNEMKRVLKKGGVVMIEVKIGKGQEVIHDERYGGAEKFEAYFSKDEFLGFVEPLGLEILSAEVKEYHHTYSTKERLVLYLKKA